MLFLKIFVKFYELAIHKTVSGFSNFSIKEVMFESLKSPKHNITNCDFIFLTSTVNEAQQLYNC
jgi:hypothetical protein